MVFIKFIRLARHSSGERIQFFSSTQTYLNRNALVKYRDFFNKKWDNDGPHPSNANKNYLGIDNGHYGLYYTMYNHDAERQQHSGLAIPYSSETLYTFILSGSEDTENPLAFMFFDYDYHPATKFFISRTNRDILNNIGQIKHFTNGLLKSMALPDLSSPSYSVRYYSTRARPGQIEEIDEQTKDTKETQRMSTPVVALIEETPVVKPASALVKEDLVVEITPVVEASTDFEEHSLSEEPFESILLSTSVSSILEAYENHNTPEQLNTIYPIYQSLKRNNVPLPNIQAYNVVLLSVAKRSLDSDKSMESTESKLTNLLTIYQDILQNGIKPSIETYNVILSNLFEGSLHVSSDSNPFAVYSQTSKSQEFGQIGIDLFTSILHFEELDSSIISQILQFIRKYPATISQALLDRLIPLIKLENQSIEYYHAVLDLTKHFHKFSAFDNDPSPTYEFISNVYSNFKECGQYSSQVDEFAIYSNLIQSLIYNNQFALASKFLDEILLDHKQTLEQSPKTRPSHNQISSVVSSYIASVTSQNLDQGVKLLIKFNKIAYLPELSNDLFNQVIVRYIKRYNELRHAKENSQKELSAMYNRIWYLYDYMAIRKDYQETSSLELMRAGDTFAHCRDLLFSLSIDLGDHARVFQLIKEVLLKNHLIFDLSSFQKLLNYLHNGVIYNANGEPFNQYYFGLIWSIVASQSTHYTGNSKDLNAFISQMINFLQLPGHAQLSQEFTEYSIRLFMNSTMIEKAVSSFDLQVDNIFGLVVVSKLLMSYSYINDNQLLNKVLKFQSRLINQFDDTENQYVELTEDLMQYKEAVKLNFKSLVESVGFSNIGLDDDITETCKILDMIVPDKLTNVKLNYDLDLSHLLRINYNTGSAKFVEAFKSGETFTSETWEILTNYEFSMKYFESNNNSEIKCSEFIQRLWSSNFDVQSKIAHLQRLLQSHNDIVTIKIAEFVKIQPSVLGADEESLILTGLINEAENTTNIYLKRLIVESSFFELAQSASSTPRRWISGYLSLLNKERKFLETITLVEEFHLPLSKDVLYYYLTALLASESKERFIVVFKAHSPAPEALRNSPEFVELLITYYLSLQTEESLNTILKRFASFESSSQRIKEQLLYARALKSLTESDSPRFQAKNGPQTINELALSLLNQEDILQMRRLLDMSGLVKDNMSKSRLVDSLVSNLLKLTNSNLSGNKAVIIKLQTTLKFFKLADFKKLSVEQLSIIIKLLTVNNSRETLNVLLTKLISNEKYTDVLNFYFMETTLFDYNDKKKVLDLLLSSFYFLKDKINIFTIDKFCKANKIILPKYDEESFKKELSF